MAKQRKIKNINLGKSFIFSRYGTHFLQKKYCFVNYRELAYKSRKLSTVL
jgi:hypothetical protein